MKNNHSCQAGQEAAQTPAAAESSASGFNRTRSKLAFDRLVEMGAKMGMENPLFLCHERAAKATTIIAGKEYLNFSTYDYLDINGHPEITAAVAEAAAIYGTSAGASRLVGGERPPHRELEQAFAKLYGVEDCIAYVSGHATNVSTLGFLFWPPRRHLPRWPGPQFACAGRAPFQRHPLFIRPQRLRCP